MRCRPSRQRGVTLIGFLLIFVSIGFVTLLTLKLFPIYFEHYKIQGILKGLQSERDLAGKTPREVISMVQKRWDINSINGVTAQDSLVVEKHGDYLRIQLDYEVEQHLLGNVSVLVKFNDFIDIGDSS